MSIIREFVRHPFRTGAVAASSRWLARAMTDGLGLEQARVVVELGPGTGAITSAILPRLAPGARLVAVELNPTLAAQLADRHRDRPIEVVNGSAADLAELVGERVDAVVSGLPWAVMPESVQRGILDSVAEVLRDNGSFATFAYVHAAWSPPARRFAAELAGRFAVLERSPVVWPNLPPAFVHRAVMPRRGPGATAAARPAAAPVAAPVAGA
ncbi:methyltransferase domain-containing protein [Micromonospora sp. NPDC049559]|uniref:class I SAM-dependent methyltransferase n=1 Tax=Micromonospora sp. NPDC049559 TaxID=3155923 RepID=UPI0034272F4B